MYFQLSPTCLQAHSSSMLTHNALIALGHAEQQVYGPQVQLCFNDGRSLTAPAAILCAASPPLSLVFALAMQQQQQQTASTSQTRGYMNAACSQGTYTAQGATEQDIPQTPPHLPHCTTQPSPQHSHSSCHSSSEGGAPCNTDPGHVRVLPLSMPDGDVEAWQSVLDLLDPAAAEPGPSIVTLEYAQAVLPLVHKYCMQRPVGYILSALETQTHAALYASSSTISCSTSNAISNTGPPAYRTSHSSPGPSLFTTLQWTDLLCSLQLQLSPSGSRALQALLLHAQRFFRGDGGSVSMSTGAMPQACEGVRRQEVEETAHRLTALLTDRGNKDRAGSVALEGGSGGKYSNDERDGSTGSSSSGGSGSSTEAGQASPCTDGRSSSSIPATAHTGHTTSTTLQSMKPLEHWSPVALAHILSVVLSAHAGQQAALASGSLHVRCAFCHASFTVMMGSQPADVAGAGACMAHSAGGSAGGAMNAVWYDALPVLERCKRMHCIRCGRANVLQPC